MDVSIRKAVREDSNVLTDISFKSKRYWNYPEEYFEIWKDELTIKDSYILDNTVYVAEANDEIIGYYSIVEVKNDFWAGEVFVMKGFWLEHIFILPEYIGKGIGTKLINHAIQTCKPLRCRE